MTKQEWIRRWRKKNGLAPLPLPERKCFICYETFTPKTRRYITCSPECSEKHSRLTNAGWHWHHSQERRAYGREYQRKRRAAAKAAQNASP